MVRKRTVWGSLCMWCIFIAFLKIHHKRTRSRINGHDISTWWLCVERPISHAEGGSFPWCPLVTRKYAYTCIVGYTWPSFWDLMPRNEDSEYHTDLISTRQSFIKGTLYYWRSIPPPWILNDDNRNVASNWRGGGVRTVRTFRSRPLKRERGERREREMVINFLRHEIFPVSRRIDTKYKKYWPGSSIIIDSIYLY